ncbi:MAG: salicylate hydroxylase, partial [Rhodoferax sp.]|nr:salicylate hydroxylase [Rhodoferax sp.]
SQESTVFNVGRYIDVIVRTPEGLKFASRHCVYDSEMIPNSIIYPI